MTSPPVGGFDSGSMGSSIPIPAWAGPCADVGWSVLLDVLVILLGILPELDPLLSPGVFLPYEGFSREFFQGFPG